MEQVPVVQQAGQPPPGVEAGDDDAASRPVSLPGKQWRLSLTDMKEWRRADGFGERTKRRAIRAVSRFLARFGKRRPWFKKLRMFCYDRLFESLERMQNRVNPCRWRRENGKYVCLREKLQCCSTGEPCRWLGETGCRGKSLSCKLWLCGSALEALENRRTAGTAPERRRVARYLARRRRHSLICRILDIPLKIRAIKEDAFDPASPAALIDVSWPDWMDRPVVPHALFVDFAP